MFPLLLSVSPAVGLYAKNAITSINTSHPASVLVAGLAYTVRWDVGITKRDFLSRELEGEWWLVWAAGSVRFSSAWDGLSKVSDVCKAVFLPGRRSTCSVITRTRGAVECDQGCP